MKPSTEILLSAAFVLTPEENWCQGAFERNGAYCISGAINRVEADSDDRIEAKRFLAKAIGMNRLVFNDSPKRKHADILNALYKAAELSEES